MIDIICPFPWISSYTEPLGKIAVCCMMDRYNDGLKMDNGEFYTTYNSGIHDIRNHFTLKEIRKKMMNGEKPECCLDCYKREKYAKNRRLSYREKFPEFIDYINFTNNDGEIDIEKVPIKIYDLRMSNVCNLECFICKNGDTSTKSHLVNWARGDNKYLKDVMKNVSDIRELYITGGEPMMIKEHWKLLQKIIDEGFSKKINLRYNTNGSFMEKKMLNIWSKYKNVHVSFSIDSIGDDAKIVRKNSDWYTIQKNIDYFDLNAPDNVTSIINCTISILNLFTFQLVLDWFLEKKYKKIENICPNILFNPRALSICGRTSLWKPFVSQYNDMIHNEKKWVRNLYYAIEKAILTKIE
jgi:uncharacterized Fe-S cluster-containing radical SAM superfamily protein